MSKRLLVVHILLTMVSFCIPVIIDIGKYQITAPVFSSRKLGIHVGNNFKSEHR